MKKTVLILSQDPSLTSLLKVLVKKISTPLNAVFISDVQKSKELLSNKSIDLVIAEDGWDLTSCSIPILWIGEEEKDQPNYWRRPFSVNKMRSHIDRMLCPEQVSIVGDLNNITKQADSAAQYNVPVLITGESGTGKELVAKYIHQNSPRYNKPFVIVNCSAIPVNLIESELFGHKKGSFTGAVEDKKGIFEAAHQGTLFLDEIGELPYQLQAKLLRALQEKKIRPVGFLHDVDVDIRVISATNRDLKDMIFLKKFREDLWHRLNLFHIEVPPLRKRSSDISILASHFLNLCKKKYSKKDLSFSTDALESLNNYQYPGNVRELENIIEKAVVLSSDPVISSKDLFGVQNKKLNTLPFSLSQKGMDLDSVIQQTEKAIIQQAMKQVHGDRSQVAKILNISPRSLKHRIHKYKLNNKAS